MAAFYPETTELREILWPKKPVAYTIWPIIEKNCWSLAFTQRFLAHLFLLSMANGEQLLEVRGRGEWALGHFLPACPSLNLCGLLNQLLKVTASARWSSKCKTLSCSRSHRLRPPILQASHPPSLGLGTMPSCGFPHSASAFGRSPFGNWLFNCPICFVVSFSCLGPNG